MIEVFSCSDTIPQAPLEDSGKAISWDDLVANYEGKHFESPGASCMKPR